MAVLNIVGGFGFLGYVLPYILYPRDENETKNLIMPRMCIPGSLDFYIFFISSTISSNFVLYGQPKLVK